MARLRDRCHKLGMRLVLDFVPNHMAVDHPWTTQRPELLIQGSENSLNREPQNFFKVGGKVFAHGKDMYYDGWEDTVQINYGNPAAREEMCNILKKIAKYAGTKFSSRQARRCTHRKPLHWISLHHHLSFGFFGVIHRPI